jgi:signal transduction histidine kinase
MLRQADDVRLGWPYGAQVSITTSASPAANRLRRSSRSAITDVALAVLAALIGVGGTALAAGHQSDARQLDVIGYFLLAAGPAALLARRRWPVAVFAVVFAATLVYGVLNFPGGPIWAALIIAFITALITGHRLVAYVSLPVGYAAFLGLANAVNDRPLPSLWAAGGIAAWMVCLPAVTELIRNRRAYRQANERRAAEERRSKAEGARRQASEERLGIARELHDVLAHSISLINVQAGVALELMDGKPEQARVSLTAIKQASKDALVEVQSVLGARRQPGEQAPRAPSANLRNIDELVQRARMAGLQVDVRIAGDLAALPAAVDSTGYRIVQEALTNVVRHAGAANVRIELRQKRSVLIVAVDDDGCGRAAAAPTPSGGNGITGMRERATALGGAVDAGPKKNGGGFVVRAQLPLAGDEQVTA